MRIRPTIALCASLSAAAMATDAAAQPLTLARLYQGRDRTPEQSERFSRRIRIARDGRVTITNVAGDILVTATTGDEVSIDATKRSRGGRDLLDRVRIVVDERPARVDIRTEYDPSWRSDHLAVDYVVAVPAGVALELSSIAGRVKVDGVKGSIRLGTVSGTITSINSPKVESLRTVSGDVSLGNVSHDGSLSISSVSGNIDLNGVKTRALDVTTVSGEIGLRDAMVDRLTVRGISGNFEYAGTLARNGRYDVNSHSGSVRFLLAGDIGFELSAASFSGSIRSDFQMTVGGDKSPDIQRGRGLGRGLGRGRGPARESLQAAYGDGSASLNLRTFSGGIVVAKK